MFINKYNKKILHFVNLLCFLSSVIVFSGARSLTYTIDAATLAIGGTNNPSNPATVGSLENPELSQIIPIIGRIFSIALWVAGIIFVAVVGYGVWKSAMAAGNPQGLEGAKNTWTYAVYGLAIVVGAGTLLTIIGGIFGINLNPASLFGDLIMDPLYELAGLSSSGN